MDSLASYNVSTSTSAINTDNLIDTSSSNNGTKTATNDNTPKIVLDARIALLATAIGGPDHTSNLVPPPYKHGDDCLACLKDLENWFLLVDERQNKYDVAISVAKHNILIDDLIPILLDWESKSSSANTTTFKNKMYYDNLALHCLNLMNFMIAPLVLNERSSFNKVSQYNELQKFQIIYKKYILSISDGKVLKAISRMAIEKISIDKNERSIKDSSVLRMCVMFFNYILNIDLPKPILTTNKLTKIKNSTSKKLNNDPILPQNIHYEDISMETTVQAFHKNKVFPLLLSFSSLLNTEFQSGLMTFALITTMYNLIKNINPYDLLASAISTNTTHKHTSLSNLLSEEKELKKQVIKNTSSRHSRFGALISIQTSEHNRLTVSGSRNLLERGSLLQKLDDSKSLNKSKISVRSGPNNDEDGFLNDLPKSLLNFSNKNASGVPNTHLTESLKKKFNKFIEKFIDNNGFHNLLKYRIDELISNEDGTASTNLQKDNIQLLSFYSWFLRYQRLRYESTINSSKYIENLEAIEIVLKDVNIIYVFKIFREAIDNKEWPLIYTGVIALIELLSVIEILDATSFEEATELKEKFFSNERIELFARLPRIITKHPPQFVRLCLELNHKILKILEKFTDDQTLQISSNKRRLNTKKNSFQNPKVQTKIEVLMEEYNIDRETALDLFEDEIRTKNISFNAIKNQFYTEPTIKTYITFLQNYKNLEYLDIKRVLQFLQRIFTQSHQEVFLFKLEFIVLLRDMLGPQGLQRQSKTRKHVENFSREYLHKLKNKLKESPAWFVALLFPTLHDSKIKNYQNYGLQLDNNGINGTVTPATSKYPTPSTFKSFPDQESLSPAIITDLQFGIIISTLIDNGFESMINTILTHLGHCLEDKMVKITQPDPIASDYHLPLSSSEDLAENIKMNRDFRCFLKLTGYKIPMRINESECFLPSSFQITDVKNNISVITKYLNMPFHMPNGDDPLNYLQSDNDDGHNQNIEGEEYETEMLNFIVRDEDEENDDTDYFKELQNMHISKTLAKGTAISKSKNKKRKRIKNNLPEFDNSDDLTRNKKPQQQRLNIISNTFINDSDEEFDDIFFENELYLNWIVNKFSGNLPEKEKHLLSLFLKDRKVNGGKVTNDYSELFDGPVPSLEEIKGVGGKISEENNTVDNDSVKNFTKKFNKKEELLNEQLDNNPQYDEDLSDNSFFGASDDANVREDVIISSKQTFSELNGNILISKKNIVRQDTDKKLDHFSDVQNNNKGEEEEEEEKACILTETIDTNNYIDDNNDTDNDEDILPKPKRTKLNNFFNDDDE
ncbi:Tof1p SCDLUD_003890 [Saccharomycodes ludwigii]|uniref:Tof1p n=1 Tax=Saccharomycodes ludwigii TaxID=36035 RepID=UPI001E8B076D|nr:hypothetical protein SCDLUD_003890 [Saccharomycodes ludwigii]KAH3899610.1 hypothetical protein SCDLUD_003890 [Saccharomycodes ludwigii]